jgi:transcriptional regulator with XRE-family HTH domain
MARADEDRIEQKLLGRALALLRNRAQMTQDAAGAAFGASGQNWQKYESGRAPGVFRPHVQRRLVAALGATVEELWLARDQIADSGALPRPASSGPRLSASTGSSGRGVAEPEVAYEAPGPDAAAYRARLAELLGPEIRFLRMPDDCLRPWATSGATITYDPQAWPRREEGCVIQTDDGAVHVKIFLRADADAIHAYELYPEIKDVRFPRTPGTQIFRVVARID